MGSGVGNAAFNPCATDPFGDILEDVGRASSIALTLAGPAAGALRGAGGSLGQAGTAGDHIVLGLEAQGLEQTAAQVGGRTLLSDVNWQSTLQTSIRDSSTRFTVSLDGVSGSSPILNS